MRSVDDAALERTALDYLARYASSSENLRRVLLRRLARQGAAASTEAKRSIDAIIARYLDTGLLDDASYSTQQVSRLRRRGLSAEGIRARLAQKGLDREHIESALAAPGETEASDLRAACTLVRRRRLGLFRSPETRAAARMRDLSVLARAGFALPVARRVLGAKDEAALEAIEREASGLE